MKKVLSVIGFIVVMASSAFMFGNACPNEGKEKIFFHANEIICSENGLFLKHGKNILRVKSIAFDENGIYVLKEWVSKEDGRDNNDEPRGAHDNNKRESSRDDHDRANSRRQREQQAAERRRQEAQRRGRRR